MDAEQHIPFKELSRAERLFRIRHSAAHIMAQAVQQMFPEASLAIGPPVANGFYYDFDLPRPLTPDDMAEIEKRMKKIVKKRAPFKRAEMTRDEALAFFKERGQGFKEELIKGIPAKINLIPFNEWPGAPYKRSSNNRIRAFADIIYKAGYASPIRKPRGEDIMAACGQLKSATERARKSRAEIAAEAGLEREHTGEDQAQQVGI